jgi:hypothetical protein
MGTVEAVLSVLAIRRGCESEAEWHTGVEGMQLVGEGAVSCSLIQLRVDD